MTLPARVAVTGRTIWITLVLFVCSMLIYYTAPMHLVEDSRFSLLVSRAILDHGTVDLNVYDVPRHAPNPQFGIMPNGYPYHLYPDGDRLYLYYPLGTPLLSLPAVWVAGHMGVSPVRADNTYDNNGEAAIEAALAAALCAIVVCLFFHIALLWLPLRHSIGMALVGGFCTPLLSTLSRSMWSQTWLVALLTISLYLVCRALKNARHPSMILLATTTALMYFVRPTAVVPILGITVLVYTHWRQKFLLYAIVGAFWAVAFAILSKGTYQSWLPPYYQQHLSGTATFFVALAGTMASPSRGWLIYTPCILLLCFLPARVPLIRDRALLIACLAVMLVHWVLISSWSIWWGGFSYGPRLMSDTVPWLFVACVLTLAAYIQKPLRFRIKSVSMMATALVVAFTLYANIGGAYGQSSIQWNKQPISVDEHPERVWDWNDPQFAAGPYLLPEWPGRAPRFQAVQ